MKRVSYLSSLLLILSFSFSSMAETTAQSKAIHISKAEFLKKVCNFEANRTWKYLGNKPAIIDFNAVWCGPCRKLSPIIEEIAKAHPEIIVYKIDVDEEKDIAQYFDISSIPLLMYVPIKGKPSQELGLVSKSDIENNIKKFFPAKKK